MDNKNLFKEAIADAKAVREAALANAKAALEEALTPKLQSMLAAKLNEMNYEEEELEEGKDKEEEKVEEGMYPETTGDLGQDRDRATGAALEEVDELEEDFDLSEILAELNEDETLEEAKEEDEEESEAEEAEEEEKEVADMTIDDLKALIADIVSQEMGDDEEGGEEAGDDMSMDMGGEEDAASGDEVSLDEEEINLEELLAELDALEEVDEEKRNLKEIDTATIDALTSAAAIVGPAAIAFKTMMSSIKNSLKKQNPELSGKELEQAALAVLKKTADTSTGAGQGASTLESKKSSEELEEAIDTINTLRAELNEVNLLNAKLLYVNKIFKAKNLTESQKLQVIASFDKATTAKEAKVVYESLNATLTTTAPKKQIKESLGFASKAAGVAPKKAIVESDDVITRMQKLANIIK